MDPTRKGYLLQPGSLANYAKFFGYTCATQVVALKDVTIGSPLGVLKEVGSASDYKWFMKLSFLRFDGDTLTGQVFGTVGANYVGPLGIAGS
jgi:hypothetical protein